MRQGFLSPTAFAHLWWRGEDLNLRRRTPTDLQSVPFGHSGTPPLWSWRWDSNPQPADYKSAALPVELRQLLKRQQTSSQSRVCQVFFSLTLWPRPLHTDAKRGLYPHPPPLARAFCLFPRFFSLPPRIPFPDRPTRPVRPRCHPPRTDV